MCEMRWVPSEADNPWADFRWWSDGIAPPTSTLQVDGTTETPRLLGPDGKPVPQTVHGFGFRNQMITRD